MKILTKFIILLLIIFPCYYANSSSDSGLNEWQDFSQAKKSKQITDWLRCIARGMLSGNKCSEQFNVKTPPFYGKLGIFVTLKKGKSVRGCYGAFFHSKPEIEDVLADYLSGALTRDPRYKPLALSELDDAEIIITVATQPRPVNDPDSVDTFRYGIAVTCGDAVIVYVPYELRGVQDLQKYLKNKDCQVSAFEAVTIRY